MMQNYICAFEKKNGYGFFPGYRKCCLLKGGMWFHCGCGQSVFHLSRSRTSNKAKPPSHSFQELPWPFCGTCYERPYHLLLSIIDMIYYKEMIHLGKKWINNPSRQIKLAQFLYSKMWNEQISKWYKAIQFINGNMENIQFCQSSKNWKQWCLICTY